MKTEKWSASNIYVMNHNWNRISLLLSKEIFEPVHWKFWVPLKAIIVIHVVDAESYSVSRSPF